MKTTLFVTAFLFPAFVYAGVLGEKSSDVNASANKASSASEIRVLKKQSSAGASFTTREAVTEYGTVTEYVRTDGVVFAITWKGIEQPNLKEILGAYFFEYKTARNQDRQSKQRGHKKLSSTQSSRVLVSRFGNMRNMRGKAVAKDLMPEGLQIGEIQ